MSHSRTGELSAALRGQLYGCTAAEGLSILASHAGALLATAPGPQRDTARALFITLLDLAVADQVIVELRGRA